MQEMLAPEPQKIRPPKIAGSAYLARHNNGVGMALDTAEQIGARILEAMQRKGVKRSELVRLLNGCGLHTNYNHTYRWTRGEAIPSGASLQALAHVLDVSESWILRGAELDGPPAFQTWLERHAPPDLTDAERKALASFVLPGQHPGPLWYSMVLNAWRMGVANPAPYVVA